MTIQAEHDGGITAPIPWSADLRRLALRFGNKTAVTDGRHRLSYDDLSRHAHGLAAQLAALGMGVGKSVATLLPNSLAAVWASYGIRLTGAAEAPLNWGYTDDEIAWSANLARFKIVITTQGHCAARLSALGLEPLLIDDIPHSNLAKTFAPVPAHAWGRIIFTSGTTGKPKGAVYTHERRWIGEQLLKASLPLIPAAGSRILLMTPFTHGASLLTFCWCDYGGEVILLDGIDTSPVRELLRDGVDAMFAPPTALAKLAAVFGDEHFPNVRCVFTGTQPLTPTLYEKACAMFGPVIRITFGKSECINPITVLGPYDTHVQFSQEKLITGTCVGWAAPGVDLNICPVDESDEDTDNADGMGQIWLRAPHRSIGMIDGQGFKPHEPDGWHQTGDLGRFDASGRLWLTGRMADVIKTGGYRVNPDEIEACLAGIDCYGHVCVTALPSDYWGEVIVAVAEAKNSAWANKAAARVKKLSRHKQPRAYLNLETLPRNSQGKISRRQTRELILATHDFVDGPYPNLSPKIPKS
jgi:acyl-CoA synthetase (AMP-forming)/AMP-acid ligase II